MILPESNMMLRSAYQVALRCGNETNWEAFANSLRQELLAQAGVSTDNKDEEVILRATCTARTYRVPSEV